MKLIKVAGAELNQTPFDWENNKNNIIKAINLAKKENVSILCLPELCITGYGCEDMFQSLGLLETSLKVLFEIVEKTEGIVVSVGLPIYYQSGIFTTACLIADKKILGFVAKKYLAGDGIHYEPRWFKPWPKDLRKKIEINEVKYPLGDYYFEVSGVKIGFEICEDAWVPLRPGGELASKGIDIILNPSASHFAFGKFEVRKNFVTDGSRAFGIAYVYSNLLGCESGRIIYDGGTIIAANGNILALGERFSFKDVNVTTAIVDIEKIRMNRAKQASFQPALNEDESMFISHKLKFSSLDFLQMEEKQPIAKWEKSPHHKKEEFVRALSLGLYDYMRKSRSNGFVLSLSGGSDSSAVASLIYLMVNFGVSELGMENFLKKISYMTSLSNVNTIPEIMKNLLTCAYQSTENSGEVTRTAAKELADAIGSKYYEFNIDSIVKQYVNMISDSLGRELNWKDDDIALQNIQARTRGPSVWLLANEKNALLLTTSNRSEAAVGYATMDGDTCGGLCPIGGIDKAFLREFLRWLEKDGVNGIFTIPELKYVNEQIPTAELRPKENKQTDENELMPYEVLDVIERFAIRDKKMPLDVFLQIQNRFKDKYSQRDLKKWVIRFFNLWCRNQWKRERYAPSFHLDDENLDPKSWCRFPILSGGYKKELDELNLIV